MMIKKVILLLLCLSTLSCGGVTYVAGLKFRSSVNSESNRGNPNSTMDIVILDNGNRISFERPIGQCGFRVSFFGVLLPIIPINFSLNNCNKELTISSSSNKILDLKIRYNKITYDAKRIEVWEKSHQGKVYMRGKSYKFYIADFWQFRMADDKAIIVTGNGFTEKLPVKWGIMPYYNWVIP